MANLSNEDVIEIFPFDKSNQRIFEKIKKTIKAGLGDKVRVEHRGSTSLGMASQNEIDVYIPIPPSIFYKKTLVSELVKIYIA
ncbi:MAG: hypothetical protein PHI66_03905 [Candidatus Pacebacteria bacterium]|nr:hypothetical protein [Candidatus Paceibacterota bacterium]